MRVPLSWLKEYVDITLPLEELAERMTLAGLEVASIERIGADWDRDKIFVGQIVAVKAHPNADRLTIAVVDYGHGAPMSVVTGAPNIHVGDKGQKVAFATVGARLIDGHSEELRYATLKPSKIRGIPSEGMVCSEKELGLSDDHEGIILLEDDAPVGMPLADHMGDVVLDIDLTPNLARCLSVIGVAREVAALTGQKARVPAPVALVEGESIQGQIEIIIDDPDLCNRYSAMLVRDVKIGPSPKWMQRRLTLAGMRPINNIVDITNYVMLEWGQPLHAFDCDWLRPARAGGPPTIIVRRAKPGEKMTTLDGVARDLTPEMLLITDGGGPVAIAGVMGGLDSEVTEQTRNVLIEAANFHAINNRRTSQALKLPSEASMRFSRGIPASRTEAAAIRAAELMRVLGGGTVAEGLADNYPVKQQQRALRLRPAQVERVLGIRLDTSEMQDVLERLEFQCVAVPEGLDVTVPLHRLDVEIEADLLEEIARMVGYDKIPTTRMSDELPTQRDNPPLELTQKVRRTLVGCGLNDALTYSFVGMEDQDRLLPVAARSESGIRATEPGVHLQDMLPCILAGDACIRLANPMTPERVIMRTTLLASLLATASSNLRFTERVNLFEVARVYLPADSQGLPVEVTHLGIVMTGPRVERSWLTSATGEQDFFDMKGVLEALMDALGVADWRVEAASHPTFHPGRCAAVYTGDKRIAIFGELNPVLRQAWELPAQRVSLLEMNLDALPARVKGDRDFQPVSRFPAIVQDMAVMVDEGISAAQVEKVIREVGGRLLKRAVLFDLYQGPSIPAGKRSLAYSLTYQSDEKTLTDAEAAKVHNKIVQRLAAVLGAQLRGPAAG
jgi:phenylalanyl-tRNA synthetase beta chain